MPTTDGQLYITAESTPGTEEAHVTGSAVDARRVEINEGGPGTIQRGIIVPRLDRVVPIAPPSKFWNIVLEMEVKAQADATTPGELATLWKACGFSENTVTDVTYTWFADPNAAANDYSVTIDFEESVDGDIYTAAGCRFGWELRGTNDGPLVAVFTGVGKYKAPAAVSSLTGGTPPTTTPFASLNTTGNPFRFHSYDMIARSFTLRGAASAAVRPSMGDAASFGYKWPAFVARDRNTPVSGEFEIEATDETGFAHWTKYVAATAGDGAIVYAAGSRTFTITCDNLVFGKPVKVPGQPNMRRCPFTVHGDGSTSSIDLTYA